MGGWEVVVDGPAAREGVFREATLAAEQELTEQELGQSQEHLHSELEKQEGPLLKSTP